MTPRSFKEIPAILTAKKRSAMAMNTSVISVQGTGQQLGAENNIQPVLTKNGGAMQARGQMAAIPNS